MFSKNCRGGRLGLPPHWGAGSPHFQTQIPQDANAHPLEVDQERASTATRQTSRAFLNPSMSVPSSCSPSVGPGRAAPDDSPNKGGDSSGPNPVLETACNGDSVYPIHESPLAFHKRSSTSIWDMRSPRNIHLSRVLRSDTACNHD